MYDWSLNITSERFILLPTKGMDDVSLLNSLRIENFRSFKDDILVKTLNSQ